MGSIWSLSCVVKGVLRRLVYGLSSFKCKCSNLSGTNLHKLQGTVISFRPFRGFSKRLLFGKSFTQIKGPVHFWASLKEILFHWKVNTNNFDPSFIVGTDCRLSCCNLF